MISHDATLVVSALMRSGGEADKAVLEQQVSSRLSCTFVACWDYLLDKGFAEEYFNEVEQLSKARLYETAKLPKDIFSKTSEAKKLSKAVRDVVARATDSRNFNANYQAVVAGKKARRDPVQEFVEEMSPIDRADFLKGWMELSDADQTAYRNRIARLARRGR